jgi:hypothetical protein
MCHSNHHDLERIDAVRQAVLKPQGHIAQLRRGGAANFRHLAYQLQNLLHTPVEFVGDRCPSVDKVAVQRAVEFSLRCGAESNFHAAARWLSMMRLASANTSSAGISTASPESSSATRRANSGAQLGRNAGCVAATLNSSRSPSSARSSGDSLMACSATASISALGMLVSTVYFRRQP